MKALALKFRKPKKGEFGSYFLSDKVLYASWHEVEKPLEWFLGLQDHRKTMLWCGSDLGHLTSNISSATESFLPDKEDLPSSIELDNTTVQLNYIYGLGPLHGRFSFVPISEHGDDTNVLKDVLVLKEGITEDNLAEELSAFEEITSGDQMHQLFEFVASERYEIAGFMCIRRLIADICTKKLRSIGAYELWRDDYYEELSDGGAISVSVKMALPSIAGKEVISWAFGDLDLPKLPKYIGDTCSGIISQKMLEKLSPYDIEGASLDENTVIFLGDLSRVTPGDTYKNLILICGARLSTDEYTSSNEAIDITEHVVFRLNIRSGREIDLCGNVDLSLITKITVSGSRANSRLFTTTDTSASIEEGSKLIEGLRDKVSHNTPVDIPGILSSIKTTHLGTIMDTLEERFDVVLVIPADTACAFDAHADSISTEIEIDMGGMNIFTPLMITASASGRSQETISSLKALDSCLSLAVMNSEGYTYIPFSKDEKHIISRKAKTNLSKDEMLDTFSVKLALLYEHLKAPIGEYVRFMTGMPISRIPFLVKEKKTIDGPSRSGYVCSKSLEEAELLRQAGVREKHRSYRYSDVNNNIPVVVGRYKEYKWFTMACDLYSDAAALKDQLHVSHEKLSLLYCAMEEEEKEKAIKSHTLAMLMDTVKTTDPRAVEPNYGEKEEELMGKHNMFSVLLGVYLFRASESNAYLDLEYNNFTDEGHLSRVTDNISSILDQSSFPILTLLRTIYADYQQTT